MSPVFADAFYWVAVTYTVDENHERALAFESDLNRSGRTIITTEEVLTEFLTFVSDKGAYWRARAVSVVEAVRRIREAFPYGHKPAQASNKASSSIPRGPTKVIASPTASPCKRCGVKG